MGVLNSFRNVPGVVILIGWLNNTFLSSFLNEWIEKCQTKAAKIHCGTEVHSKRQCLTRALFAINEMKEISSINNHTREKKLLLEKVARSNCNSDFWNA